VRFYSNNLPLKGVHLAHQSFECPICKMILARDKRAIHQHFSKHIREGMATKDDLYSIFKQIGLWDLRQ